MKIKLDENIPVRLAGLARLFHRGYGAQASSSISLEPARAAGLIVE